MGRDGEQGKNVVPCALRQDRVYNPARPKLVPVHCSIISYSPSYPFCDVSTPASIIHSIGNQLLIHIDAISLFVLLDRAAQLA